MVSPEFLSQINKEMKAGKANYLLVAPSGEFILIQYEGSCQVVDLATQEPRFKVEVERSRFFLQISADSTAMATFNNGFIEVRDTSAGAILGKVKSKGYWGSLGRHILGPSGGFITILVGKKGCCSFNTSTGELIRVFSKWWPMTLALSGNGQKIILGGSSSPVDEGYVQVFDVSTGDTLEDYRTAYIIEKVDISYEGNRYALEDYLGLWISECPDVPPEVKFPRDFVFIKRGEAMIAAMEKSLIKWKCDEPESSRVVNHDVKEQIHHISAADDGKLVAIVCEDRCCLLSADW